MEDQNWNSFKRMIYINAPMEKVYNSWAVSKEIETWFLKSAEYTGEDGTLRGHEEPSQTDDTYVWMWHNWPDAENGKVTNANGTDLYELTFADSIVTIELSRDRDMTLCSLTQHHIPEDDKSKMRTYWGCGTGWTFWMTNLKAYLEHNILLHEVEKVEVERHTGMEYVNM